MVEERKIVDKKNLCNIIKEQFTPEEQMKIARRLGRKLRKIGKDALKKYNSGAEGARESYERISELYSAAEPFLTKRTKNRIEEDIIHPLIGPSDYALILNGSEQVYSTARRLFKVVEENGAIDSDLAAVVSEWIEDKFKPEMPIPEMPIDVYGTKKAMYLITAKEIGKLSEHIRRMRIITQQEDYDPLEGKVYLGAKKLVDAAITKVHGRKLKDRSLLEVAKWYLEKHMPDETVAKQNPNFYERYRDLYSFVNNSLEGKVEGRETYTENNTESGFLGNIGKQVN